MYPIVIFGPPGSGKGTYGKRIANVFGLRYISTGEIIREKLEKDEDFFQGEYNLEKYSSGEFLGDRWVNAAIQDFIQKSNKCLIDGYPRTIGQSEFFINLDLDFSLISLEEPKKILISRMTDRLICPACSEIHSKSNPEILPTEDGCCRKCNAVLATRNDDNIKTMRNRIDKYITDTKPVLEFLLDRSPYSLTLRSSADKTIEYIVDKMVIHLSRLWSREVDEEVLPQDRKKIVSRNAIISFERDF